MRLCEACVDDGQSHGEDESVVELLVVEDSVEGPEKHLRHGIGDHDGGGVMEAIGIDRCGSYKVE